MTTKCPWYATIEGILDHIVRFENAFAEYDNTEIHLLNIEYLNRMETER